LETAKGVGATNGISFKQISGLCPSRQRAWELIINEEYTNSEVVLGGGGRVWRPECISRLKS